MNNTQLIENTLLLEKKVKEQAETIQALEKKVEGIHNVVYQLVGGLFNQRTQDIVLEEHMRHLFPDLYTNNNFLLSTFYHIYHHPPLYQIQIRHYCHDYFPRNLFYFKILK